MINDSKTKHGLSSSKFGNNREVINLVSDDEGEDNNGHISVSSAPFIHSNPIGFDPKGKRVRNSFETMFMIGREPSAKRPRIWSEDVYRRFLLVANALGGPAVAPPKEIKDRMDVPDVTEDEIVHHLMKYKPDNDRRPHGVSPIIQYDDLCLTKAGRDALKLSRHLIESGTLETVRMAQSSKGQMAAAGNNTNGRWNLMCSAHGTNSVPHHEMLKMRGMPIHSGSRPIPLLAGDSSNNRMAVAPNEANGGRKLVGGPCISMPMAQ